MKTFLRSRFTWLAALAVVILFTSLLLVPMLGADTEVEDLFDHSMYDQMMSQQVESLEQIVQDYEYQQADYLPILVPDPEFILVQDGGTLPFDPKDFSDAFLSGLVPVQDAGITTYPISVCEDLKTRERVVLNAKEARIGGVSAPLDYDPQWYVKKLYPSLPAAAYLDPSD